MKLYSLLLFGVTLLIGTACTTGKTTTYWVSGTKVDCTGVGRQECLQVQRGENLGEAEWENFYASIDGFEFEEGYLKKIEVREEQLEASSVPADASSVKYTFVKELDRQRDAQSQVNGTWKLTELNGKPIDQTAAAPTLTIDLIDGGASGTDGCNRYAGRVEAITATEIQFGTFASTKKMCANMQVADPFNKAMNGVTGYGVEGSVLTLLDISGEGVLTFERTE